MALLLKQGAELCLRARQEAREVLPAVSAAQAAVKLLTVHC